MVSDFFFFLFLFPFPFPFLFPFSFYVLANVGFLEYLDLFDYFLCNLVLF